MARLSELGSVRTGFQLRGAVQPDETGGNLLIQQGDLRDDEIDLARGIRMNLDRPERDTLRSGDVLLRGRGASYGAVLVPDVPPDTVAIAPLVVFRPDTDRVLSAYIVWFINRPATQALLAASAHGTYVPTVSARLFSDLELPLPPLAVQRQVAETTALLRQERHLAEQLLAKREQWAQAALEQLIQRTGHP